MEPRARRRLRARGFTLLEVLVAVSILGLGLTAILSAQAGAFSSAAYARNLSVATGLARCKMTEVEEHVYKDGFQETDETGSGPCCDQDDSPNMRCTWRVDRPQFPEARFGDLQLNAGLNLSGGSGSGSAGQLGALGLLSQAGAGTPLAGASNISDVAKTLADANSQAMSGMAPPPAASGSSVGSVPGGPGASTDPMAASGMGGLASMAMSFVYPSLKLLFEASTRRATVVVSFRQGQKDHSVELTQWITMPQKGLTSEEALAGQDTGLAAGAGSSGSASGGARGSASGGVNPVSPLGGRGK